jgi:hypothetical protein
MTNEMKSIGTLVNVITNNYLSLFKYNSMRIRTLIYTYIWVILSISYFVSNYYFEIHAKSTFAFLGQTGLFDLISYLISGWLSLTYPRKDIMRILILASSLT